MKMLIAIMSIAFALSVAATIASNTIYKNAKHNRELPKIPFAENLSFCPLKEAVYDTQYEKNSALIVDGKTDYIVGDRVVVEKEYQDESNYFIENMFLVGVVSSVDGDGYNIMLYSPDNKYIEIDKSEIAGKVRSNVAIMGLLYNNMLGARGYVLFGVVPALVLVLLGLIASLTTVRVSKGYIPPAQEDDMQYEPELENQIADRINRVNANVGFNENENENEDGDEDCEMNLDIDNEDIKLSLENVPVKKEHENVTLALEKAPIGIAVDDGDIKLSLERKSMDMGLYGGETQLALENNIAKIELEKEPDQQPEQQEIKPESESELGEPVELPQEGIAEKLEKKGKEDNVHKAIKLQYEKPSDILNRILIKKRGVDFDIPQQKNQSVDFDNPEQIEERQVFMGESEDGSENPFILEQQEQHGQQEKQGLTADEIIKMYREQNEQPQEPKDNKLDNIAKLYYDNNLENYD